MKTHKVVDNIGKIIVDSMLVVMLLAIIALPASSISLLHVQNQTVLSASSQFEKPQEFDEINSSYRPDLEESTSSFTQSSEEDR